MRFRKEPRTFLQIRPSIPLACALALFLVVGVIAGSGLCGVLPSSLARYFLVLLVVLSFVLLVISERKRTSLALWVGAFLILGMALSFMQMELLEHHRKTADTTAQEYMLVFEEDSTTTSSGSKAVARLLDGDQAGAAVMLFMDDRSRHLNGDVIKAEFRLSTPGADYQSYYDQKNIAFQAHIDEFKVVENPTVLSPILNLRKRFLDQLGEGSEEITLLRAVLLGERSDLFDASFYHAIKVAGLAHLVAVSGAHLVIVTGFVTLVLKRLRLSNRLSIAIQSLFLLTYLALVGFPISCIRAAIMSFITLAALLARRRSSSLSALGTAVIVMVALDPSCVFQLSFQLSVTSTLGIVFFMPFIDNWLRSLLPALAAFVRESVGMTLAALMCSLPISVATFSTVPLISPLANVVATPFLTLILVLGFLALPLMGFFPWLLGMAQIATLAFIKIISFAEMVSFSSIPVSVDLGTALFISVLLIGLIWVLWPQPKRHSKQLAATSLLLALLVILGVGYVQQLAGEDRIVMLDVGQGDSFALVSKGHTLLIDTGKEPQKLYASLARNGIRDIDAVLITHPDEDHCGSLDDLKGVVSVERVIIARDLAKVESEKVKAFIAEAIDIAGQDDMIEVESGSKIMVGDLQIEIIAPDYIQHEGENEDSIVLFAGLDCDHDGSLDYSSLFCGDAEAEVLEQLMARKKLHQVDIFKVGHHGSKLAVSDALMDVLQPKIALIGVGKNSYGHPRSETLATLQAHGSEVFRSDLQGDVVCTFTRDGIQVKTQR